MPEQESHEEDQVKNAVSVEPRPVQLPSRREWLSFLSDEVEVRDRRMYWGVAILFVILSGCYYLASGVLQGGLDAAMPTLAASVALGLLIGLWAINQFFPQFRDRLRPPETYAPPIDSQLVPLVHFLAKNRVPYPPVFRELIYVGGYGTAAAATWQFKTAFSGPSELFLLAGSLALACYAFFHVLATVLLATSATGLSNRPNSWVGTLVALILRVRLPQGVLTDSANERLDKVRDEDSPTGRLEEAIESLAEARAGSLLGLSTQQESGTGGAKYLSLGAGLLWRGLIFVFIGFLAYAVFTAPFLGDPQLLLFLSILIVVAVRLALELVKNPERNLLAQLRLAVLHDRLTMEEAVYAHSAILSLREIGMWSPPQLMSLLLQFDVISRQRYLEASTYPETPEVRADDIAQAPDDRLKREN